MTTASRWRRISWRGIRVTATRSPESIDRGGEHRTPYGLQHTFATFSIAAGVGLFDLSRLMDTSLEQTARTYGHLLPDSLDRARAALHTFLADRAEVEKADAGGESASSAANPRGAGQVGHEGGRRRGGHADPAVGGTGAVLRGGVAVGALHRRRSLVISKKFESLRDERGELRYYHRLLIDHRKTLLAHTDSTPYCGVRVFTRGRFGNEASVTTERVMLHIAAVERVRALFSFQIEDLERKAVELLELLRVAEQWPDRVELEITLEGSGTESVPADLSEDESPA